MFGRRTLRMNRQLAKHVRGLQEIGPADEDVGNRLQKELDELAEIERMVSRARSKIAAAMWQARGALRELGAAVPALTRPPSRASGARPEPGSDRVTFAATDAGPCRVCGEEAGSGPIGWGTEPETGPVCAHCLRDRSPLAFVLVMVDFTREMGEKPCDDEEEEDFVKMALSATWQQAERMFFGRWAPSGNLPEEELFRLLEEIGERNEGEAGR